MPDPTRSDGTGAEGRWRHTIGAADAATILSAMPTKSSPDKASGEGPQDRRGKAPEQTGADGRWRHTIGAADAATILSVLPTKSSPDKASGEVPQDRRGKAPEQTSAEGRWRHTIGAADAAHDFVGSAGEIAPRQSP